MSVDFPRAWEIANAHSDLHHPACSYASSGGALLCDCEVLYLHREYLDDVLHTSGGHVWERDFGGIEGGYLLALAIVVDVALVYLAVAVQAGTAR